MLIAGRLLNGVCVGVTSSQVPVYLAEIAKKEKRGSIIVIQQLAIEWGIFIMFFVGYGPGVIPYSMGYPIRPRRMSHARYPFPPPLSSLAC